MVVFFLALLLILAVALSVVAAFAMPHLRAGSPLLTDRGERLAEKWSVRLQPVSRVVLPVVRPIARWVRRVVRPLVHLARPKVAPLTQAISRAVEEGTAPPELPRRSLPSARPARSGVVGLVASERGTAEPGTDDRATADPDAADPDAQGSSMTLVRR